LLVVLLVPPPMRRPRMIEVLVEPPWSMYDGNDTNKVLPVMSITMAGQEQQAAW
jgi:hypothetical protein